MDWPQDIMIFSIDGEWYGLPLAKIEKILHASSVQVYPVQVNLPSLYGYCQQESELVPLIDIRILLRKVTVTSSLETSILVTRCQDLSVGLLCDSVRAVVHPETPLVKLPTPLLLEAKDYFSGVFLYNNEAILIFNPQTLFRPGDLEVMAETSKSVLYNLESLYGSTSQY